MDWNRAKNIMIVMFLIINIFLSYQLYSINRNQYQYMDEEQLQSVIEYMEKKNIVVEAELPRRVPIAPSIKAKYYEFDSQKLQPIFFGAEKAQLATTADGFSMKSSGISIEASNGISLSYANAEIAIKQSEIDEKKCMDNAYNFIKKLKLNLSDQYIKLQDVEKGYIRLILGQTHNDIPIEGSQIEILATEEGVAEAKIQWLEWTKTEKRYNVITPVMALLKAFADRESGQEKVTVKEIKPGYYLPKVEENTGNSVALEYTLSPMWVVVTGRDEIYVNAYNENIEN